MELKKKIRLIAYSSIISAIVTLIIVAGSIFDMVDIACAAVCSFIIHIVFVEVNTKTALLIYAVSATLSIILIPLRACSLLFTAFFGYYPVLRSFIYNNIKIKKLAYLLLLVIYNTVTISLFIIFKNTFGVTGEPTFMYVILIITSNIFFVSFEMLMRVIMVLYNYKFKKHIQRIIGKKL